MIATLGFLVDSQGQSFVGVEGGPIISTLTKTDYDVNSNTGLHYGLVYNLPLSQRFSLMTSVLYAQKGFDYTNTTDFVSSQTDVNNGSVSKVQSIITSTVKAELNYIDIPIALTVYSNSKRFFVQEGVQLSFKIKDKMEVVNRTDTAVIANSFDTVPRKNWDYYTKFPNPVYDWGSNNMDFSVVVGAGYKHPKFFMIYMRATLGFINIQKGEVISINKDNAGHSFTFEAGLALYFGWKGKSAKS